MFFETGARMFAMLHNDFINAASSASLVEDVFGLALRVITNPESETPLVIPLARDAHHADIDLTALEVSLW